MFIQQIGIDSPKPVGLDRVKSHIIVQTQNWDFVLNQEGFGLMQQSVATCLVRLGIRLIDQLQITGVVLLLV
jgi:hypothetical protein